MTRIILLVLAAVLLAVSVAVLRPRPSWSTKKTPVAGWTWDDRKAASSSVSTLDISDDGAWGSLIAPDPA